MKPSRHVPDHDNRSWRFARRRAQEHDSDEEMHAYADDFDESDLDEDGYDEDGFELEDDWDPPEDEDDDDFAWEDDEEDLEADEDEDELAFDPVRYRSGDYEPGLAS